MLCRVYPAGRGKVFIPVLYGETLARLGGRSCYRKRETRFYRSQPFVSHVTDLPSVARWETVKRLGTPLLGRSFLYGLQFDKIYYC